jgi:hypothetical protein
MTLRSFLFVPGDSEQKLEDDGLGVILSQQSILVISVRKAFGGKNRQ